MNNRKAATTSPAKKPPLKKYMLTLNACKFYRIFIEAASPDDAEKIARAMYDHSGLDAFELYNSREDDNFDIYDADED